MCNRYAADIRKAGKEQEYYGFEEWSETRINTILEVFPKSFGPVITHDQNGHKRWQKMRWGLPGLPQFGGAPVTNIRNIKSAHWRPLLGPEHRCLVPFTAFSEYEDVSPKGAKVIRWFAPPNRGVLFFAGVWRSWEGDYGSKKEPNQGQHMLFSFFDNRTKRSGTSRPRQSHASCSQRGSGTRRMARGASEPDRNDPSARPAERST